MENNETFNYTYSAKEQEEIKEIRKKYFIHEKTEDKLSQLRRLDTAVTKKATLLSLVFGITGTLIMGTGMSLTMTDIGNVLGISGSISILVGILIGIIGIALISVAYPIYNITVNKERKKIAPEIISLTNDLMK